MTLSLAITVSQEYMFEWHEDAYHETLQDYVYTPQVSMDSSATGFAHVVCCALLSIHSLCCFCSDSLTPMTTAVGLLRMVGVLLSLDWTLQATKKSFLQTPVQERRESRGVVC